MKTNQMFAKQTNVRVIRSYCNHELQYTLLQKMPTTRLTHLAKPLSSARIPEKQRRAVMHTSHTRTTLAMLRSPASRELGGDVFAQWR